MQNGSDGVKTITYKETYTDGKLTSKKAVSSKITKQPVDKIVKVGTKDPAITVNGFLKASEARKILSNAGLKKSGNTYYYDHYENPDYPNYTVVVVVGNEHAEQIKNDAGFYRLYSNGSEEWWKNNFDERTAQAGVSEGQKHLRQIESKVRIATSAVYGKDTARANQLYNQIMSNPLQDFSKSF